MSQAKVIDCMSVCCMSVGLSNNVMYSVTLGSNDMLIERDIRKYSGGNIKGASC